MILAIVKSNLSIKWIIISTYLFINNLYSQQYIVTISKDDFSLDKSIPFDQPFTLKIPFQGEPIREVLFYELQNNYNEINSLAYIISTKNKDNIHIIKSEDIKYFIVEKQNYAYVNFNKNNLFKPNKKYAIITRTNNKIFEYLDFFKLYLEKYSSLNDSKVLNLVGAKLDTLLNYYSYKIEYPDNENDKKKYVVENGTLSFGGITSKLILYDSQLRQSLFEYINFNYGLSISKITINENYIKNLINSISASPIQLPSISNFNNLNFNDINIYTNSTPFIKTLFWLHEQSNLHSMLNLIEGKIKIGDNSDSAVQVNIESQILNIKKSLELIIDFKNRVQIIENHIANSHDVLNNLNNLVEKLEYSLNFKNQIKNELSKMRNTILTVPFEYKDKNIFFRNATINNVNTQIYSFELRNKYSITPYLSLSFLKSNNDSLRFRAFPSMGFSINLKPINRDVKYYSYKKNLLQKVSIDLGWSLVNFNNSTYTSFFEKSTVYTGLGYRISNLFRFQTGYHFLFKQSNNKTKLNGLLTGSISLDLSIKDLINGFPDVISGIKGKSINKEEVID